MGIAEKEEVLPVFDTDILNTFFLPNAEIATQPPSKIGIHESAAESLRTSSTMRC